MLTPALTFYDASTPPAQHPMTDGVCIYIGGDTPHVWTTAEINRQSARYRLPIWVRSDPVWASAPKDAAACLSRLAQIGAPRGTLVALDVETAVDPSYVQAFGARLLQGGYKIIVYGSQSTVFGNDVADGWYWGADWTGRSHIHAGDRMTQWVAFRDYDLSVAGPGLPFWDTRPPKPPAPPAPAPTGAPTGVAASNIHGTGFDLRWDPEPTAPRYSIRITYQGNAVRTTGGTGNMAAITGLTPDHTYGVHVAAGNAAGYGPYSYQEVHTPRA